MFALRVVVVFLFGIALFGCSESKGNVTETEKSEKLPKIDRSKFRDFTGDGFRLKFLKNMTRNEVSGFRIFEAEFLPEEYHITISAIPENYFEKDADFPKSLEDQLSWMVKKDAEKMVQGSRKVELEPDELVFVENQPCVKQTMHGFDYGFPLRKTIFLRYSKMKGKFVKIKAWTISENAKEFEKLVQYMGMTLQLKD